MRLGWYGETDRVNVANKRLPFVDCLNFILPTGFVRARVIDIADADELRTAFIGERRMNARMLLSQVSDTNDRGSKHKRDQRPEIRSRRSYSMF